MPNKINAPILFQIYAQNRDGLLIIKNLQQHNFFICRASDIINNRLLLKGFSPADIRLINVIATEEIS